MTIETGKKFLDIELNPQQQEAVFHPAGPIIVYAGAGTGKTRVITCRIARLILEMNVHPSRILAITFTNKAADEMKRRVIAMVMEKGNLPSVADSPRFPFLWISTFHSFCARTLKIDSESFGVAKDFCIYDEDDQKRVIKEILKELRLSEDKNYRPHSVAEKINRLKDSMMDAESFALNSVGSTDVNRRIFTDIYLRYARKLEAANALDFGDLILKVVEKFRSDKALLEKYQKKFDHILVDEYQDTNAAQYYLVKYLASAPPHNVCVVGDDDQSIYSWRGADRRNIMNFRSDYPSAKIVKLEQNYRSTPQILRAAVSLILHNVERHPKILNTAFPDGENIGYEEFSSEIEEAQAVVFKIKNLIEDEKIKPSGIAVLYRTNAQSRVLEDAFISAGIPYRLVGSVRFYERQEVKNIIAYLRVIRNPSDDVSLKRIINIPARGVGDATLEKLNNAARQEESRKSIFEVIETSDLVSLGISARSAANIKSLVEKIKRWRVDSTDGKIGVSELAKMVAEESGYLEELQAENTPESLNRIENIKELVNAIAEYEEVSASPTLGGWLDDFALTGESDRAEGSSEGVVLTTIHLAKGLEFDVVFIVGMEESVFPLASSWRDAADLEEERRLCYVAITRAKKKLFMSGARIKMIYGKTSYLPPSRFVREALSDRCRITTTGMTATSDKSEDTASSETAATSVKGDFPPEEIKGDKTSIGSGSSSLLRIGVRVRHKIFGTGVISGVTSVDDDSSNSEDLKVVVKFDSGSTRKFYARYAGFEILQ